MKKTVKIVKEIMYEIEIDEAQLTQESVDEFEVAFWELDGCTLDQKIEGLFKFAAGQLANGEEHFIEGLGPCASVRTVKFHRDAGEPIAVVWSDIYEDIETEIV